MYDDSPPRLREHIALRRNLEAFAEAAGLTVERSVYIDPADCVCPAEALRYDGDYLFPDFVRAGVTCMRCGSSRTLPMRADVAALRAGGPRGPESDSDCEASMDSNLAAPGSGSRAHHGG